MTARTFWIVVLRTLTIAMLLNGLILGITYFLYTGVMMSLDVEPWDIAYYLGGFLVTIGIYLFIFRMGIDKAGKVVDRLGIAKEMESEMLTFQMSGTSLIQLGIIIVGGISLVNNFFILVKSVFDLVTSLSHETDMFSERNQLSALVWNSFYLAISYVLVIYSGKIAKWVESKSPDQNLQQGESDTI